MIIKTPVMLDTSYYEIVPDFAKVNPKPLLVITKATEGTTITDPKFATYWADLKQDGIARGAYHFFRKAVSVSTQAALFIKTVKSGGVSTSDIFVLDVEETGVSAAQIIAWLDAVEAEFGNLIMIYSRKNLLDPIAVTTTQAQRLRRYPVWTAGYPTYPDNFTSPPAAYIPDQTKWGEVWAWQYTESAVVSGITGEADASWMSQALINRVTPQQPSESTTLAEINAKLSQMAGALASVVSSQNNLTANINSLGTLVNGKLDSIVSMIDALPTGGTTNPPAADLLDYTGPYVGEYRVKDDGSSVKFINIPDSYDRGTSQMPYDTAKWLQTNFPSDWNFFVDKGWFTKNADGLWFYETRVYRGQKVRIAEINKQKNTGRVIGFCYDTSRENQPSTICVHTPVINDWLFMTTANGYKYPQIQPWKQKDDTVANAIWVNMALLEKVS